MAARPRVDRSAPPSPGEIRPFRFPPFLRTRLANGLAVAAARLPDVPLVSLELVAPAGGQFDPEGQAGVAALSAALLDEGTARRSSIELAAFAERLGGYITTGADWDVGFLATGLLADHRAAGLELLAEIVSSPTFPEAEIERLRRQRLAEILRRSKDPSALADDRFAREVFRGSVYAHRLEQDAYEVRCTYRLRIAELIGVDRAAEDLAGEPVVGEGGGIVAAAQDLGQPLPPEPLDLRLREGGGGEHLGEQPRPAAVWSASSPVARQPTSTVGAPPRQLAPSPST